MPSGDLKFVLTSPMTLWCIGPPIAFFAVSDVVSAFLGDNDRVFTYIVLMLWGIVVLIELLAIFWSAAPHFVTAREVEHQQAYRNTLYPGLEVTFEEEDIFSPYLTRVVVSVGGHRRPARSALVSALSGSSA